MKTRSRFAAVCACGLTILASGAIAQMGMRPQMPMGIFTPTIGAGGVYDETAQDGRKTSIEYDLVGKESVNGRDGYWLEFTTNQRMGQMVMKMLVVPGSDQPTAHLIMQMGKNPPMDITQMAQRGNSAKPNYDVRNGGQDLGKESVTVPAGTFNCEHYRSASGGDTWVSSQVPPFGMVKSVSNGTTLVLTKVVSEAKDKITGTPVPFNPMMMQGMQNQ
ncbi:MAG: hypothetical protein WCC21_08760 [Candidatus Acidiferrales bacterium]